MLSLYPRSASGLVGIICLALAAGCTMRPPSSVLQPISAIPGDTEVATLFVATNRTRRRSGLNEFTNGRAEALSYAQFEISIPPGHVPGKIEWPDGAKADPRTKFATVSNIVFENESFLRGVTADAVRPERNGNVVVFVHGYNNSFQEALFRFTQIVADMKEPGVPVLFSWPSVASPIGYAADMDSMVYSRDDLESLLDDIAAIPEVRNIHIVGHSMGSWLVAEALRQARMRGSAPLFDKLGDVVLAAPDIDADVFRTQLEAIGELNRPITLLISRDDRFLKLSKRVAGGRARVGTGPTSPLAAEAAARRYNLRIVDITKMPGPIGNHENYISSIQPLVDLALMAGEVPADNRERTGFFELEQ